MNGTRGWIPTSSILATAILGTMAATVVATPVAAQDDVLTVYDVARLRGVGEVAIAPGGGEIAYVLSIPRVPGEGDDGPAWAELHVVDRDGSSRPYVSGEVNVGDVDWTPDGQRITFLAKRQDDEHSSLWAIPLDGGEAQRLLTMESDVSAYDVCADGVHVAVVAREAEDKKKKKLSEKGFNQKVVEEDLRRSYVWVVELGDGGLAAEVGDPLAVEGHVTRVNWSPSCDRLAVLAAPTSLVDDTMMQSRLRVIDAETSEVVARIENPGKVRGGPVFSPDGAHLAMISAADLNDPGPGRLMVAPASGGDLVDLLPGLEGHVRAFAWASPRRLVYLVHEGTEARLAEVGRDGSGGSTLIERGGPIFTSLSRAENGEVALAASTPSHPGEVFHQAPGKAAKKLTDSNEWLSGKRLAPRELVRYKARDGLEIEGLLVRPLDEEAGKRHPLILVVHGGPEGHYSNGWLTSYSQPAQTGAARGFAVFFQNYRASTGRGVEFSKLDHGDPAGKEFDDLVDGVDHLIAAGLVDRGKVAITGASYGGYATAWGATYYSERFAAAVMFVGISEKIAKFGTSDIPNELMLVHDRHWPWEDFQMALERSPVYHMKKARTPILILGGLKDTRVYPGQSMTLFRFLKTLGQTPVRLVQYPDERHGNRNAAARLDYSLRQLRWIEHYLRGPGGEPPDWDIEDLYGLEDDEDEDEEDEDDDEGDGGGGAR